ncbi:MAG: reverse transcriptase N-terminal domain-containing protein, partial [Gammaproteobacteria bacterium]
TSHFEDESWAEKPWKKFEKVVFRLQKRIYKARSLSDLLRQG